MITHCLTHRLSLRALCALATGLALTAFVAPAAFADCNEAEANTSNFELSACDADWQNIEIDGALIEQSSRPSKPAENGTPWIAQRDKKIPVTVNSTDAGVTMRTSLDDLHSDNAKKSPLDVWTSVDVKGYDGQPDQGTRAGVGVDYNVSRAAKVGVSAERGGARTASSEATEADTKASAYVTLQATPMLSLDARTEWQAGNAEFAAVSGVAEKSSVTLAPKLNHSFALDDGKTIEPYITYKREFDVSTTRPEALDAAALAAERSAEAGVKYVSPDAYTLSVTTGVDGLGASQADRSVSSKFQLSVPIN